MLVSRFSRTSGFAVVTPIRPKSHHYVIKIYGGVFVVTLLFEFFCGCRCLCHRTELELFLFLLSIRTFTSPIGHTNMSRKVSVPYEDATTLANVSWKHKTKFYGRFKPNREWHIHSYSILSLGMAFYIS